MYNKVFEAVFEARGTVLVICDPAKLQQYGKSCVPAAVLEQFPQGLLLVLDFNDPKSVRDFTLGGDAFQVTVGFESVPTCVEIPFWTIRHLVLPNPGYAEPEVVPVPEKKPRGGLWLV